MSNTILQINKINKTGRCLSTEDISHDIEKDIPSVTSESLVQSFTTENVEQLDEHIISAVDTTIVKSAATQHVEEDVEYNISDKQDKQLEVSSTEDVSHDIEKDIPSVTSESHVQSFTNRKCGTMFIELFHIFCCK